MPICLVNRIMKRVKKCHCKVCSKDIAHTLFKKHMEKEHGYSEIDAFIEQEVNTKSIFKNIPEEVVRVYMKRNGNIGRYNIQKNQFITFYRSITMYRDFDIEKDIEYFFTDFLPWKLEHPKVNNCRRQCDLIFHDNKELADRLYKDTMLSKNPYYNHGGKFSPFSDKFVGYKGLSQEEKNKRKHEAGKFDKIGRNPNQKEYWMRRGYSEEESRKKVYEHINIFSLENCIKRYGEELGRKKFTDRQIKWQNTLKSKPIEEINRINHDKVYKNGPKSGVESEFLNAIYPHEDYHNKYIKELGVIVDIVFNGKIIEFYGDYWHCNPNEKRFVPSYYHPYLKMTAEEKWDFDRRRIEKIKNAGYEVKIVWEHEYMSDKDKVISDCKEFLGVD